MYFCCQIMQPKGNLTVSKIQTKIQDDGKSVLKYPFIVLVQMFCRYLLGKILARCYC